MLIQLLKHVFLITLVWYVKTQPGESREDSPTQGLIILAETLRFERKTEII